MLQINEPSYSLGDPGGGGGGESGRDEVGLKARKFTRQAKNPRNSLSTS